MPCRAIERNVAGQHLELMVLENGEPKTGDAANLTAYVSIDGDSTPDALTDTSATEVSATDAPGVYRWDLTQGETNGKDIVYSVKSSTSGVFGVHRMVAPTPANSSLAAIDFSGRHTANVTQVEGADATDALDSIKAVTFDESTAFPLKSADTTVLRKGSGSITFATYDGGE